MVHPVKVSEFFLPVMYGLNIFESHNWTSEFGNWKLDILAFKLKLAPFLYHLLEYVCFMTSLVVFF